MSTALKRKACNEPGVDDEVGLRCALYAGHRGDHVMRVWRAPHKPFKVCPRCTVAQSLALEFQQRSDGSVFSWCKACNRAYKKDRRAEREAGL